MVFHPIKTAFSGTQNKAEDPSFWIGAFAWKGSVSPKIALRSIIFVCYAAIITIVNESFYLFPDLDLTPFELCGAVLGVLLVFRTNAGYDRWWEARKLWGGIVNQSRNLIVGALAYGPRDDQTLEYFADLVIGFPYAAKNSLRNLDSTVEIQRKTNLNLPEKEFYTTHQPSYFTLKIAETLNQWKEDDKISPIAFLNIDKERLKLLEYVGACERILKTPMPLVYVIKVRRFLLLFLLLVPIGIVHLAGFLTPGITLLVAYPLLALDQIGLELQNPFSRERLSHLPIDDICDSIRHDILNLVRSYKHNKHIREDIKKSTTRPKSISESHLLS
ncbi:MAG: bestrophin family protein [Oligoflexales bacterium]